jgi:hypothetical protein
MIPDMDVLTVAAIEGRLNDRVLTDLSQQLPEDELSFRFGLGHIVEPEPLLDLSALRVQLRIETVVDFSGEHFLFFSSWGHPRTPA